MLLNLRFGVIVKLFNKIQLFLSQRIGLKESINESRVPLPKVGVSCSTR